MHSHVLGILLLISVSTPLNAPAYMNSPQDIMGGAALIFIRRPQNPPVRRRVSKVSTKSDTKYSAPSDEKTSENPQKVKSDLSDEIEDALALANSARDTNPPRYQDAELAYRLATKLNPKDPRPYVGLGNIWYDQKQYAEAAKMYKQAVMVMAADSSGRTWTIRGKLPPWSEENAKWRAYLGATLLQARSFSEAEVELREAISLDSNNANWHAQLGYCLLEQNKFSDASRSLKVALRLDPKNAEYQQLLKLSLARRRS
jgi:Flp pilus assembly protein TadD